jgi:hypothetical protein
MLSVQDRPPGCPQIASVVLNGHSEGADDIVSVRSMKFACNDLARLQRALLVGIILARGQGLKDRSNHLSNGIDVFVVLLANVDDELG